MAFSFWKNFFVICVVNIFLVTCAISDQFGKVKLTHCDVVGTNDVTVKWKPVTQHINDDERPFSYSLFYCKYLCTNRSVHYSHGCTITDRGLGLHCNLGALLDLDFPSSITALYYYIRATNNNGSLTSISKRFSCNINMEMKCTVPRNLEVKAITKRRLQVRWSYPLYMGSFNKILCYRLSYAREGSKENKTNISGTGKFSDTLIMLEPYSKYTVYVACAVHCNLDDSYWGQAAGPVISSTLEEAPSKAPMFQQWHDISTYDTKRNVLVIWKLPQRTFWNGKISNFTIDYWAKLPSLRNQSQNGTVAPLVWQRVINDSSVTQAALKDLNQSTEYKAQIRMCTGGGCSQPSSPFTISSTDRENLVASNGGSSAQHPWLIPVVAGILGTCLLIILLAVVVYLRHRCISSRRNQQDYDPGMLMQRVDGVEPYTRRYSQVEEASPESDPYDEDHGFLTSCETLPPDNQSAREHGDNFRPTSLLRAEEINFKPETRLRPTREGTGANVLPADPSGSQGGRRGSTPLLNGLETK